MNYYDDTLIKIDDLIKNENYEQAKALIISELNISYVPREFERKLKEYLDLIKERTYKMEVISDEEIIDYLNLDEVKQLLAIKELNNKNLRDYIDICEKYLKDGTKYKQAKVLLIESLIEQEINYVFDYVNDSSLLRFNPKDVKKPTDSDGFIEAYKILDDHFMKNPSMFKMASELLYKQCIMALPLNYSKQDGIKLANNIIQEITKAFEC